MRQMLFRISTVSSFVLVMLLAAVAATAANGQSQLPVQLVSPQALDQASLVTLRGNTHPLAQSRYDRGTAPTDMPAARIMLLLKRSQEQESSLQSYLQAVQDARSPYYRKFLTPEEFGKRFGVSDADLGTVKRWLQGQGFTVNQVNKGRTAIEFSGTIGQLQQAFHTTIHRYLIGGAEHLANASDPRIPAALSQVVAGVASLNDFKPRAHVVKGPKGRWSPELQRFTPELTITSGGGDVLLVGPGDAATIYDAPDSLNARLASGQAQYDGTGVTIGVAGDTWLNFSDISSYRISRSLPYCTGTTDLEFRCLGGQSSGDCHLVWSELRCRIRYSGSSACWNCDQ
jgi:subtilase family serine protease